MIRKWIEITFVIIACGLALGVAGPTRAQSIARRGGSITLQPAAGQAGTQVHITGMNYSSFCAGYILIDDQNTGVQFHCNGTSTFEVTITWPDGLDNGNHRVTANSIFGANSATFNQIAPLATPVPTDTPGATDTPSAGGATGGNPTPPVSKTSTQYYSNLPAVLALVGLCGSVLVLGAGMTMLILLWRRRDQRNGQGLRTAYVPPPPPPPDVPPDPENPWVWPNDPFGR